MSEIEPYPNVTRAEAIALTEFWLPEDHLSESDRDALLPDERRERLHVPGLTLEEWRGLERRGFLDGYEIEESDGTTPARYAGKWNIVFKSRPKAKHGDTQEYRLEDVLLGRFIALLRRDRVPEEIIYETFRGAGEGRALLGYVQDHLSDWWLLVEYPYGTFVPPTHFDELLQKYPFALQKAIRAYPVSCLGANTDLAPRAREFRQARPAVWKHNRQVQVGSSGTVLSKMTARIVEWMNRARVVALPEGMPPNAQEAGR